MKVEMQIKPFAVPNELHAEPRPTASSTRPVDFNEISPDDLGKLCDDFKRAVFDKAGYSVAPTAKAAPLNELTVTAVDCTGLFSATDAAQVCLEGEWNLIHSGRLEELMRRSGALGVKDLGSLVLLESPLPAEGWFSIAVPAKRPTDAT